LSGLFEESWSHIISDRGEIRQEFEAQLQDLRRENEERSRIEEEQVRIGRIAISDKKNFGQKKSVKSFFCTIFYPSTEDSISLSKPTNKELIDDF
jgi:hypothetical protein